MSRNLDSKIRNVLDDIETLNKSESIRRIKNLVEDEIQFHKDTHLVEHRDLDLIKSMAAEALNEASMGGGFGNKSTMDYLRTFCYLDASVKYMNGKGLIKFHIKLDTKE